MTSRKEGRRAKKEQPKRMTGRSRLSGTATTGHEQTRRASARPASTSKKRVSNSETKQGAIPLLAAVEEWMTGVRKGRGRGKEERGSRSMEEEAWKRGRRARNWDWDWARNKTRTDWARHARRREQEQGERSTRQARSQSCPRTA